MTDNSSKDPRAMAERYLAWLLTPEGQAAQAESDRRLKETEALLAKGRDIPWEKLHEPFTI